MIIHTFYICLAVLGTWIGLNNSNQPQKWQNIQYASLSGEENLDIYLPQNPTGNQLPALVLIGDDDWQNTMVKYTLRQGYAAVCIHYRSVQQYPFPASIQDVNAALKWLKENGGNYGMNPDKLILCGAGEGGYLAALAGTTQSYIDGVVAQIEFGTGSAAVTAQNHEQENQNWITLFNTFPGGKNKEEKMVAREHPKVACVIDFYGFTKNTGKIDLSNSSLNQQKADIQTAPQTYATPYTPPFLMIYGENDAIVPMREVDSLYQCIKNNVCPPGTKECLTELMILPDTGHGGVQFETPYIISMVFAYISTIL